MPKSTLSVNCREHFRFCEFRLNVLDRQHWIMILTQRTKICSKVSCQRTTPLDLLATNNTEIESVGSVTGAMISSHCKYLHAIQTLWSASRWTVLAILLYPSNRSDYFEAIYLSPSGLWMVGCSKQILSWTTLIISNCRQASTHGSAFLCDDDIYLYLL